MSNDINPNAKSARESARQGDGTFGHQVKAEPMGSLSDTTTGHEPTFTELTKDTANGPVYLQIERQPGDHTRVYASVELNLEEGLAQAMQVTVGNVADKDYRADARRWIEIHEEDVRRWLEEVCESCDVAGSDINRWIVEWPVAVDEGASDEEASAAGMAATKQTPRSAPHLWGRMLREAPGFSDYVDNPVRFAIALPGEATAHDLYRRDPELVSKFRHMSRGEFLASGAMREALIRSGKLNPNAVAPWASIEERRKAAVDEVRMVGDVTLSFIREAGVREGVRSGGLYRIGAERFEVGLAAKDRETLECAKGLGTCVLVNDHVGPCDSFRLAY